MKKLFVFLFAAMLSCGGYSQTTWNVRVGLGYASYKKYWSLSKGMPDEKTGYYFGMLQCNIPVVTRFSVCPTLTVGSLFETLDCFNGEGDHRVSASLSALFGYRAKISHRILFFPKVGPIVTTNDGDFGVAVDLPFETKHFVIGPTGYYADRYMIGLTVGYKF